MTNQAGRLKAAWTLVVLAPLCAEAAFSGVSTPVIWLALPLLVPIYGAGVLLVRELVRRAGAGWPGLLLLGLAYELAEDGLGLQALTSPHLYTAAEWGPRVLGFNTTYWESQAGYHLVFTVLIPVALTELIFRRQAGRPWLGPIGLAGTAVVFVLGVGLARVAIAGSEDPGYQASWPVLAGVLIAMIVLAVLALVVLPRLRPVRPAPVARPPQPWVAAVVAGIATMLVLGLLVPLGHDAGHPAAGTGAWVWLPMAVALVVAVAAGWLVARWCVTDGFTDHHRIWLIGGALVGHTLHAVLSGVAGGSPVTAVVLGAVVVAATVLLLGVLDRRVRTPAAVSTPRADAGPGR